MICGHSKIILDTRNGRSGRFCDECEKEFLLLDAKPFPDGTYIQQPIQYAPLTTPTLRDQFAMAVLPALLAQPTTKDMSRMSVEETRRNFSRWSYEWADAMLEARK